jgi:hypothetical protein
MNEQLALASLLVDADRRGNERRDLHRGRVQAWFDSLPDVHRRQLGEWMISQEWDTCSSLSIAACDDYLSRQRNDF